MTQRFENGNAVLENCLFCGATFEEAQRLGDKIECDESQGGCGNVYKVSMYAKPVVKSEDE
jgi:hypothetical protein